MPWCSPVSGSQGFGRVRLARLLESGSGKTTLGRAILKLGPPAEGCVLFDGEDIAQVRGEKERRLRRRMQIVFQDPYSSLDLRRTVGQIVGEGLRHVDGLSRTERNGKVKSALEEVELDPDWCDRYPHELSGGQRQRVGIARAIAMEPQLVIADEAVSALDLTVQAQVLRLLKRLQNEIGFSYLFITHDLGVVEQIADRILVMYRGRIVEIGSRDDLPERFRVSGSKVLMFGFSGGAHFTHRFVILHPRRVRAASIGAPGAVTLLDGQKPWWTGIADVEERFGMRIDMDAYRGLPLNFVVGAVDVETWEITFNEADRYYMPGANDAGRTRMDRIQTLADSFRQAGAEVRLDVVPGATHEVVPIALRSRQFFHDVLCGEFPSP